MATKKVAPYTESEIEKDDSRYSIAWRLVKYSPNKTVVAKLCTA